MFKRATYVRGTDFLIGKTRQPKRKEGLFLIPIKKLTILLDILKFNPAKCYVLILSRNYYEIYEVIF